MGELTQMELKTALYYDRIGGNFYWRNSPSTKIQPWAQAGTFDAYGYVSIKFKNKFYKAHRLAWLYVHGEMPQGEIDHVDHQHANNQIENLRVVNRKQNSENTRMHTDNVSGFKGVTFDKRRHNWFARIMHERVAHHLGVFDDPKKAAEAYKIAAKQLHTHNHINKD